jgi:hypothetical protein
MKRTTTITIRWFLPVCWFKGQACLRCGTFQSCYCYSHWGPGTVTCQVHNKTITGTQWELPESNTTNTAGGIS